MGRHWLTKCLKEVAAKAGWGQRLPRGQGRGIAIGNWGGDGKPERGPPVPRFAKVEVSKSGQLKILQIDVAFDTGRVLNRDAVATQLEGGTLFGLNMSLNEELNIKDGRIVEGNYDQYPMIRMADVPRSLHVHFGGLSNNARFTEIGEPPVRSDWTCDWQCDFPGNGQTSSHDTLAQARLELDLRQGRGRFACKRPIDTFTSAMLTAR